jgi:hypothetical protein
MADNLIQMQHSTKAPAGFTHGSEAFDSDEDGIISLPSHLVGHAKTHGFSTEIADKKQLKVLAKAEDAKAGGGKKAPAKTAETEDAEDAKAGGGK